jgi:hypothetical protein
LSGHLGEAVEELVFWTEDDGRTENRGRGKGGTNGNLGGAFGRGIAAPAGRVGADRRHVHQAADAARRGLGRDARRAFDMHRLERSAAALGQRADQIDDDIGLFDRAVYSRLPRHRAEQRHDLSDRTHRLEKQRGFRIAYRDPHHVTSMGQPLDHIATDEARAAEHSRHLARRHRIRLLPQSLISRMPFRLKRPVKLRHENNAELTRFERAHEPRIRPGIFVTDAQAGC